MSDTPQGPGWWQASDDRWYPPPRPDLHETAAAPTSPPTPSAEHPPFHAPNTAASYDSLPTQQPTTTSNRTVLYVTISALAVVAIISLTFFLLQDGGSNGSDPGNDREATDEAEPLGDGLVLLESGYSNALGGFLSDEPTPTYGLVVENTGDQILQGVQLGITLRDADGAVVDHQTEVISVIQPGERFGFGKTYGLVDAATTAEVADLDIAYGGTSGGGDPVPAGGLTASDIATSASGSNLSTTFSVTSEYDHQIDNPVAHVIYRNAQGRIIGGANAWEPSFIPANGTTGGRVTTVVSINDLDPDRTEVYVDHGM